MRRLTARPVVRVIRQLGSGGTADVTLVEEVSSGQCYACKQARGDAPLESTAFRQLLDREWELIGSERFPGLVRLAAPPEHAPERLFLELCAGPDAASLVGAQPIPLVLNLLAAIAVTLEFLYARGIVHADLKLQNFFLPQQAGLMVHHGLWYVKLSDFSLGRRITEPETARLGLGTIGFLAPETMTTQETSHRSDLFALGVMAYQLITGRHPFVDEDSDVVRITSRVCNDAPKPISTLRAGVQQGLIDLVMSLLSKQPSTRPASGWHVCHALLRLGATYPVERALQPLHLIRSSGTFSDQVEACCRLSDVQKRQLHELAGESTIDLRLIVQRSWQAGQLHYRDGRFELVGRWHWPSRVRRRLLGFYAALPMQQKKALVRSAALGLADPLAAIGVGNESAGAGNQLDAKDAPLVRLLEQFLRPRTVRRISHAADELDAVQLLRLSIRAGRYSEALSSARNCFPLLLQQGRPQLVSTLAGRLIEAHGTTGSPRDLGWVLMQRGQAAKDAGEYVSALANLQEAVQLAAKSGDRSLEADVYRILGDLYRLRQEPNAGLQALERARQLYELLGDQLLLARVYNNKGNLLWSKGEPYLAGFEYRKALRIQRTAGETALAASTLHNLASTFVISGRLPRAIRLLSLALHMKRAIGDPVEIARTLNNLGYATMLSGKRVTAISYLEESLQINRTIGSQKEILYNLENLTSIMISAGKLRDSLSFLQEGMTLADTLGDRAHAASFQVNMATVYCRLGRIADAEQSLGLVDRLLTEIEDPAVEADALLVRAQIARMTGDVDAAAQLADRVRQRAAARNDAARELEAALQLCCLDDDEQRFEALRHRTAAAELAREQILLVRNRIEWLLGQTSPDICVPLLQELLRGLAFLSEDIEESRSLIVAGEALIHLGKFDAAAPLLQRALQRSRSGGLVWELHDAEVLCAVLQAQMRDYPAAAGHARRAAQVLEKINGLLGSTERIDQLAAVRLVATGRDLMNRLAQVLGVREGQGQGPVLRT